ncbi:Uncharacterized protein SCF082_LOCUS46915, partial [Durusdinium trenchii]
MPPVCLDITDVSKDVDKGMLPPHSVFLVKGWTRSVCANTILACCWEMSEFLEAGLQDLEPLMFLARLCRHSQKRSKSFPAEPLQRCCAAYLACVEAFRERFPEEFVKKELPTIEKTKLGYVDLVQLLESSVPPVDLDRVAIFRQAVLRFNKEAIRYSLVLNIGVVYPGCKVERAGVGPLRIAQMVANATFQQSESQTQLGLDALQEFLDK